MQGILQGIVFLCIFHSALSVWYVFSTACSRLLFLLENGRNQVEFSLAVFVAGFCVNLQKEVTAGCLANCDNAQWGSSTLEYESLQISRVFILGLIRSHPSPPSSPSAFFPPVSLIPLLNTFLFTRTFHLALLHCCHSHHSLSLSFCNFPSCWNRKRGCVSLWICLVFPSSFIQKLLIKFDQIRKLYTIV